MDDRTDTPPDDAAPPPEDPGDDAADDGADDATLGGYLDVHDRPPAFEGPDGHPYTVSPEIEKTGDLRAPWQAYLVFPKWAETGVGIVGHVETRTLCAASTREAAEEALRALSLFDVQAALDRAVAEAEDGR